MHNITHILSSIEHGDAAAAAQLLPRVSDELRKLAAQRLAQEKPGQTLQATALVHDAYLRLVDVDQAQNWISRGHFFAAAAEAMRRILIDAARRKHSRKHGGSDRRVNLDEAASLAVEPGPDILDLDDALTRLAQEDLAKAELVKLRFFASHTVAQAAEALGISRDTATRHWAYAKVWLYSTLTEEAD